MTAGTMLGGYGFLPAGTYGSSCSSVLFHGQKAGSAFGSARLAGVRVTDRPAATTGDVPNRSARPTVLLDVSDAERRQAISDALTAVGYEIETEASVGLVVSDDPDASPDIRLVRRSPFACRRALSEIRPRNLGAIILEDDLEGLVLAVIACHSGYRLIHDDVIEIASRLPPVTPRARVILEAVMAGESTDAIATNLDIAEEAVRHELVALGEAWQAPDDAALLAAADELGLRARPSDLPGSDEDDLAPNDSLGG
jgi:hypothetical protein